jgi:hypothetical protein
LLINGDRLTVNGGQTGVRLAGNGFAAAVTEQRIDGHLYAIPDAALAFLGRGLDLSLFNVAALPGDGRLPVRIGYTGRVPHLPGITITSAAGGLASGYLTAASAPAFGAALVRQFTADHDRGSYGADGMFGGGVWISLAGAAPSRPRPAPKSPRAPRAPEFPMHVLTVHGVNQAGKPDTGDMVYVMNSDNFTLVDPYESGNVFYRGTARYSLPAGHYWAIGAFFTPGKVQGTVRIVVDSRFTVTGNTSVTIRALSASSELSFTTPKPATVSVINLLLIDRISALAQDDFAFISPAGVGYWLSPTRQRLASGSLREFVMATLALRSQGPLQPQTLPAIYSLAFAGPDGVIGSQHFTADSLATVHASYSSGVATTGAIGLGGTPTALFQQDHLSFIFIDPASVPTRQTEYLSAGPGVYWFNSYFQSDTTLEGGQADTPRTFTPGEVMNTGWNTYPLHTALDTGVQGGTAPLGQVLSATRFGNGVSLMVTPFSDGTASHTGSGFSPGLLGFSGKLSGRYRIDDNGKTIASGNAAHGEASFFAQVNLPAKPSTVTLRLDASRTGRLYPLSTATSTTWTWRSANRAGAGLPPGWSCADGSEPPCAVEPLLTLGYSVAGIAVDGTAPAGPQVVRLTIGHQQFAAASAITAASASVSFDDGATWQPASVTGSGGTRYAVFDAPAGSYVSLKVTAADAAGGAIAETLIRAYATAVPPYAVRSASSYRAACPATGPGEARCFVLYSPRNVTAIARAAGFGAVSAPAGWGARDIERAYRLPVARNPHQTVAVVEAFDTPLLESYLNTYRRQYGLGPCTTANGCFRKVNGAGQPGPLPADGTGTGWDLEATLDVDMVSAACPRCRILVVEARSQAFTDLAAAENTAVRLGAAVVSNSYGGRENGLILATARDYYHPGHAIVASSGDFGYTAASYPADLTTVTSVGGTELSRARNGRGWLEKVWNEPGIGAGASGCSAYVAKPRWQHDAHCSGRTVADVAALAWEVAVYDKFYGGWVLVGGTSASSPIVAGIYGLAGNAAKAGPGYEYAHARALFDVTAGNNDWWFFEGGGACGNDYMCVAKKGYDAPTGLGTPDGMGAF